MDYAYFKVISKPFQKSTNWTELRSQRDILEIEIWFGRLCDCAQEKKNVDGGIRAHTGFPSRHLRRCVWAAVWNGYQKLGSNFVSTSDMTWAWLRDCDKEASESYEDEWNSIRQYIYVTRSNLSFDHIPVDRLEFRYIFAQVKVSRVCELCWFIAMARWSTLYTGLVHRKV